MKKILLTILILIGLSINLFAIWPTDEVVSDIFSPDIHAVFVIALPTCTYDVHGSTIYITESQLNNILTSIEASSKAITQGLTNVKFEIHASSEGIVIALTKVSSDIIASSNAVVQALKDVGNQVVESSNAVVNAIDNVALEVKASSAGITQAIDNLGDQVVQSSNAITEKLTGIQGSLNAGTTIFNSNPQMLYSGQTIYKSSGTAGLLTSATGVTITVADKVKAFYFLYESPSGEYCKIEPSTWGVPIRLSDGKYSNILVDYPEAITFTISDMVVGSTLTWVVPVVK